MTANVLPSPRFQYMLASGAPAAGYKLFTYAAGTSTKRATYVDSTQTTQNANPVVLDSAGSASVWLDPSLVYKLVLALPGDTDPPSSPYWSVDNISSQTLSLSDILALLQGLSWKASVRAASTANGNLATAFAAGQVMDGVTLVAADRILLKNQTAGAENGLYTVNATGAPTRATDADIGTEMVNATCYVSEGTVNADTQWVCTTNAPITLGSTALTFVQVGAGGGSVTSVGLSLPGIFTVSGSPVTTSGVLTAVLATQSANQMLAGPTSGAAAQPTFRALVTADIPKPAVSSVSTSFSAADTDDNTHKVLSGATQTLTLGSITAGVSFTVRCTTAWSITCAGGLSKNGAAPGGITSGSIAANSLITFFHEGSGVWLGGGAGLS